MLIAFLIYLVVGVIVLKIEFENAPLYDERNRKFIYKEWYTIFGRKIKRRNK